MRLGERLIQVDDLFGAFVELQTDKASMLDEIIDYVKFLQLQVKVLPLSLSLSRLTNIKLRLAVLIMINYSPPFLFYITS